MDRVLLGAWRESIESYHRIIEWWTSLLENGDFSRISVFQELFKIQPKMEKNHSHIKNIIKENLPANL